MVWAAQQLHVMGTELAAKQMQDMDVFTGYWCCVISTTKIEQKMDTWLVIIMWSENVYCYAADD